MDKHLRGPVSDRISTYKDYIPAGLLVFLMSRILYPKLYFSLLSLPFGSRFLVRQLRMRREAAEAKRDRSHTRIFLEALISHLNGSYNFEGAMEATTAKLSLILTADAPLMRKLNRFVKAMALGAGRSEALDCLVGGGDDVFMKQLVASLKLGLRQGIDCTVLIGRFHQSLVDYQDLIEEREAGLAAVKREQNMLFLLPFLLLPALYLSGLGSEAGILSLLSRLIFLLILIVAWKWSSAILTGVSPIDLEGIRS